MLEPVELPAAECEALLRTGVVGRVAVSTPDGPHIIPVDYSVVDDLVVVRTTPYSVLGTHARGAVMAFEVDHLDRDHERCWSVVVRGRGDVVDDRALLEQIRRVWPPQPGASHCRTLLVGIRWVQVSGRRLGPGWDPLQAAPPVGGSGPRTARGREWRRDEQRP